MLPIERLYTTIARTPTGIAIGGPRPMTYRELGETVNAVAAGLQAIDREPGSRVGVCAKNNVEHLIALLASYRAGKVWVPLNPRNGKRELDAMIGTARPTVIIADTSCVERFTRTDATLVLARTDQADRSDDEHTTSVAALAHANAGKLPEMFPRDAEAPQVLKFSGGSTGAPKCVVQPVRCINAQADGIRDFFEFQGDDVNLIAAPLTHGASCFVLPLFERGGRHVLLEDASPASILDCIEREGVTTLYAPPTMLYGMLGAASEGRHFPTLRHVIYSAAPMTPERIRECQRVFGPVIETAYGQVEAPQIITGMRAAELLQEENLSSVGRPTRVAEVRIAGENGGFAGAGGAGEIIVRGPLVMSGYLDQPAMTSETIVDGWLRTGDTGTIDERGYLYIRGRIKETINTGGFKVYPGDVEAVLARHAAVAECAVFGVPDDKWGEAVTAAVVRMAGASIDVAELIAYVKAELGSVKAPKVIHIVDALPRNAAGKVSRGDVRRLIG